jgi:hypothetical protein
MIKDNLRAIAILKQLSNSPSDSEKYDLGKFNGWGSMWQVFKPEHPQHEELKSVCANPISGICWV